LGRRTSVVAGKDEKDTEQFNTIVGASFAPDGFNRFSIEISYNNNQDGSLTSIPGAGSTIIDDDENDCGLSLRYTSTYDLFGRENKAILGVDVLKEEVDSASFSNFPDPFFPFIQRQTTGYERKILGVYLHDDFSVTDRILLSMGARFDSATFEYSSATQDYAAGTTTGTMGDRNFDRLSPKASVTYLITDHMSCYASYAKSFRLPNRDELTGFFGFTPQLDPEEADSFEVGIKPRFGTLFSGGISLYHMKVEDEILLRPPNIGAFAFGQNENFEEVTHRGVEISAESGIIPRMTIFGSYTLVETEIERGVFKGSRLPITPKHSGYIGATLDLSHGLGLWSQVRFVGERYMVNDLANAFEKLPAYTVWDAKLSYTREVKPWSVSAFFGVNNILDEDHEEFGGVGGFPFGSRKGFFPSPERSYTGGITLNVEL
ncbi:TonB-dependent receptor, partial [Thermodesulfobacteriota bacterium]